MDQLAKGIIPVGDHRCRFDYRDLEREMRNIVSAKLHDENASMEEKGDNICPTFVVASPGLHGEGPPKVFRSYKCRGQSVSKCAIWEAGRATSASPLLFKEICIETPKPATTFIDGGFTHNNPSELSLNEAQRRWPSAKRFCLISIGTGRQRSIHFVETGSATLGENRKLLTRLNTWSGPVTTDKVQSGAVKVQKILKACAELTQSSEAVHERIWGLSHSNDPTKCFPYHRFNVDKDMDGIDLQEWHKFGEISEHATSYMATGEGERKRDRCVTDLIRVEGVKRAGFFPMTFSAVHQFCVPSVNPGPPDNSNPLPPQQSPPDPTPPNGTSAGSWISPQVDPLLEDDDPVKSDDVEAEAVDDEEYGFGSALYPEDDWLSNTAYSREPGHFHGHNSSEVDTLIDTDIAFTSYNFSRAFDDEEAPATPKPVPAVPAVPAVKPLSLCAYDFAEAVCREHFLTGKTEFVDCAIQVLKQLVGSRRANLETHHHYACLLWADGQWNEACVQFEIEMELNPINANYTPGSYVQQYICDSCGIGRGEDGVSGLRFKCVDCRNYDMCDQCFPPNDADHIEGHKFVQIPSDDWLRANGLVFPLSVEANV
jgi:Zinc finger, ZZ type